MIACVVKAGLKSDIAQYTPKKFALSLDVHMGRCYLKWWNEFLKNSNSSGFLERRISSYEPHWIPLYVLLHHPPTPFHVMYQF